MNAWIRDAKGLQVNNHKKSGSQGQSKREKANLALDEGFHQTYLLRIEFKWYGKCMSMEWKNVCQHTGLKIPVPLS